MKVYYSAGLLLGLFLSLGIYAYILYEETDTREWEELSTSERIDRAKAQLASRSDEINFENARITNNNAYCASIVDEELKELCYELVTNYGSTHVPKSNDDVAFESASITGSESYCLSIDDRVKRAQCLSEIRGEEVEPDFTPSTEDRVLFGRAVSIGNPVFCDMISVSAYREECLSNVSG